MARKKAKLSIILKTGVQRSAFAGGLMWRVCPKYKCHHDDVHEYADVAPVPVAPTPGFFASQGNVVKNFQTAVKVAEVCRHLAVAARIDGKKGFPKDVTDYGEHILWSFRTAYKEIAASEGCLSDAVQSGKFSAAPAVGLSYGNMFVNHPVFNNKAGETYKHGVHPICFPASMAGYKTNKFSGPVSDKRAIQFATVINALNWGDCRDVVFCIDDDTGATGVIDPSLGKPSAPAHSGFADIDATGKRFVIQGGVVTVATSNSYVTGRSPFRDTWHANMHTHVTSILGGTYGKAELTSGFDYDDPAESDYATVWENGRSESIPYVSEKHHATFKVVKGAKDVKNLIEGYVVDPYVVVTKSQYEVLTDKSKWSLFKRTPRAVDFFVLDSLLMFGLGAFVASTRIEPVLEWDETIANSAASPFTNVDVNRQMRIRQCFGSGKSFSMNGCEPIVNMAQTSSAALYRDITAVGQPSSPHSTPKVVSLGPVQKATQSEKLVFGDTYCPIDVLCGTDSYSQSIVSSAVGQGYVFVGLQGGWSLSKEETLPADATDLGLSPFLAALVGGVYDVIGATGWEMNPSMRPIQILRIGENMPADRKPSEDDGHPEGISLIYGGLVPSTDAFGWWDWVKRKYPKTKDTVVNQSSDFPYAFATDWEDQ